MNDEDQLGAANGDEPASLDAVSRLARTLGVDALFEVDHGVDWALPLIEELMIRGVHVLVKFDGDRPTDPVTVVISGQLPDTDFVRRDGANAGTTLIEALAVISTNWDDPLGSA